MDGAEALRVRARMLVLVHDLHLVWGVGTGRQGEGAAVQEVIRERRARERWSSNCALQTRACLDVKEGFWGALCALEITQRLASLTG